MLSFSHHPSWKTGSPPSEGTATQVSNRATAIKREPLLPARVATAPISWGICEVPGWGAQLPPDRVLAEMASLGFPATEFGSDGYLPADPEALRNLLGHHQLDVLGGWVSLVAHQPDEADETLALADATAKRFAEAGASFFVTALVTDADWSPRQPLSDAQWQHVSRMLGELGRVIEGYGLTQVLHSHVDTIIETDDEVQRIVDTTDVLFCLDTAHLAVGGYDPVDFVTNHADRVGLVHLKDVDLATAAKLNADDLTLLQATHAGMWRPLGRGDIAIDEVIVTLESSGYAGWYVLEQDTALTDGVPPEGEGPMVDVEVSLDYLRSVESERLAALA